MGLKPEKVRIQIGTTVGTPGRGKETTWADVPGNFKATRNYKGHRPLILLDKGGSGAMGPGVEVRREQFFEFKPPFPTLARDKYQIIGADGLTYRITRVRTYDNSLQVDVEVFV